MTRLREAIALGVLVIGACTKGENRSQPPPDAQEMMPRMDAGSPHVPQPAARIPFACNNVTVQKASRFRGQGTPLPVEGSELAAFRLTTRVSVSLYLWDAAGVKRFDNNNLQLARVDAHGRPLNRLVGSTSTAVSSGPVELVAIGTIPKGTKEVTLLALDAGDARSSTECRYPVTIAETLEWPPLPRYEVIRIARTRPEKLLVHFRADNVMPEERPAPELIWKPPAGYRDREGLSVLEVRVKSPTAAIRADEKGQPAPPNENASTRFAIAEFRWTDAELPNAYEWTKDEYTTPDPVRPLPPLSTWDVSERLSKALDESRQVIEAHGEPGLALFVHGGKTALMRFLDAGAPPAPNAHD